ncbi:MAG: hypothetical protein DWB56_11790 [Candidatus Jettenia sp.]|uniref:Uncharacterized protein n=1 Tax=Candidatus Jettenia caeni TaxID=247490 RepID=I3IR14_9BACT|nr:hypothetical protein [Candidatus Jettenia sp. AMX1]MBC6929618.1 hypothetical protein [Candidatus Jettenia sp.]NUN21888.1 hypothetical protein [Candidatus Jettenia caeni]KAA0247945.1 MAG: hypothetical protein EDM77_13675 [Candidatus Jettenia sp. AMX1]MCE7879738.1 hypothetical protein [Candidatus Jettenia sp. AMX1]MCQ3927779.1 hypothetical protein [Candidatus Jettenia sp.]
MLACIRTQLSTSLKRFSPDKSIRWLMNRQISESAILAGIAIFVGLTSGAGVWLFKQMFSLIYQTAFDGLGLP